MIFHCYLADLLQERFIWLWRLGLSCFTCELSYYPQSQTHYWPYFVHDHTLQTVSSFHYWIQISEWEVHTWSLQNNYPVPFQYSFWACSLLPLNHRLTLPIYLWELVHQHWRLCQSDNHACSVTFACFGAFRWMLGETCLLVFMGCVASTRMLTDS